jgi:carboxylesterase type B
VLDATPVVERSLDIGHPVILVTLNYRLGVLGFIHSAQLQADAAKQEDIPPHFRSTGNLALLDTYMAFKWVTFPSRGFSRSSGGIG